MKKVIFLLATIITMSACTENQNPFMTEWNTPEGVPPFEQIKVEHYQPAFEAGIAEQAAEIEAIVNSSEAPTFENTILALDRSGKLLAKVSGVFFNLTESDNSPEMIAVMNVVLPLVSEHGDNIYMNAGLYKRVAELYNNKEQFDYTTEQLTLLNKIYKNFIGNGVGLPEAEQARMREINKEISALQQTFGNNIVAETNAYQMVIENEADLAGLP